MWRISAAAEVTCLYLRVRSKNATRSLKHAVYLLLSTWILVMGFNLSYHNEETLLFAVDPHDGNLDEIP